MADDMSQENDENYARRLMQGGGTGGNGKRCPASVGEYTPMWELRRTVRTTANGTPANEENPYGGTLSIATLPSNCCNKSVTFTTFKPGENPYGTVNRYGLSAQPANGGVATLMRQQKPGPCLYEQNGELLYSTHSKPDILTDGQVASPSRTGGMGNISDVPHPTGSTGAPSTGDNGELGRLIHAHRSISRDLCEQCVVVGGADKQNEYVGASNIRPVPGSAVSGQISQAPSSASNADVMAGSAMLNSPL